MKASAVYLKAAERLDKFEADPIVGCCYAIVRVKKENYLRLVRRFCAIFNDESGYAWFGNNWSNNKYEVKCCRVLALLLMSAIAADEERGLKPGCGEGGAE